MNILLPTFSRTLQVISIKLLFADLTPGFNIELKNSLKN